MLKKLQTPEVLTMLTTTFSEHLKQIPDHRGQNQNLEHPLVNVLTIGFCGIITPGGL